MEIHITTATILALLAPLLSGTAAAAVVDSQPAGFEVREEVQIAAPPDQVYAAFGRVGGWWSSDHTFSHDSQNLSLDLHPGGCWCERMPDGGGVRHLSVIMVMPNKLVRLEGALGPLTTDAGFGRLTLQLTPQAGGTDAVLTYDFGGYAKGGMAGWVGPVDHVLGDQLERLRRYVTTGRPDAG